MDDDGKKQFNLLMPLDNFGGINPNQNNDQDLNENDYD